ncbi:MAG: NUDIX domain-containing protein [Candidatus Kerfeldbacteria bacterium]|nr:NUDIX domain-containing protein [Candidatus Kerfeldbacteria bacterium]
MKSQSKNSPKEATSAGGIVVRLQNNKPEILLLRDKHFADWTLPKGHVEKGETLEQAALREIFEEAGVTSATIIKQLRTFRRFVEKSNEWKTIHYFLITTQPEQPLDKLESEDFEIQWFSLEDLPKMYLPEQQKVIVDNLNLIRSVKKEPPSEDEGS